MDARSPKRRKKAANLSIDAELLREAFLWAETRVVTKVATVSLFSNHYQVDPALVGRRVELVFDPFDLTVIEVRVDGRPMGTAIPHRIGRHSHPAARPEPALEPPTPTGIDYLRLVETQRDGDVASGGGIPYQQLALPDELIPTIGPDNRREGLA